MQIPFLLLFLLYGLNLFAQPGKKGSLNASVGVDAVFPSGGSTAGFGTGYGGTVKGEWVFARHLSATASGSYLSFAGEARPRLQLVPLQAGFRYYLGQFYAGAEAGYGFESGSNRSSGFLYSFSLGDEILTGRRGNSLDLSGRITTWSAGPRFVFYGIRAAYEFRFR